MAKRRIVNRDIIITVKFLLPMTLFLSYTITGMEVTSLGFSTTIISIQQITVQIKENGTAAAIQVPNEISIPACSRYDTASAFCRLEIGVIMPPKLQAKAKPKSNDFENLESLGKSLTIGRIIAEHRIGAVWLLIHIDRNSPSTMTASMKS